MPSVDTSRSRNSTDRNGGSTMPESLQKSDPKTTGSMDRVTADFNEVSVDNATAKPPYTTESFRYWPVYSSLVSKPTDLQPDPTEWVEWRANSRSNNDMGVIDPKLKESRYQSACRSAKINGRERQRWPLPYESFAQYATRQADVAGRSKDEQNLIEAEYELWRMDDPDLMPEDNSFERQRFMEIVAMKKRVEEAERKRQKEPQ